MRAAIMNTHRAIDPPVPPGFAPLDIPSGFVAVNGPLYLRRVPGGGIELGMRIEPKHANPKGVCHGGMLMTFADILLAVAVRHAEPSLGMMPTVSMSSDFVAPAPVGAFLTGTGRLLKRTRNLAFADGCLRDGDRLVLRASGVLKIPSRPMLTPEQMPRTWRQAAATNSDAPALPDAAEDRP